MFCTEMFAPIVIKARGPYSIIIEVNNHSRTMYSEARLTRIGGKYTTFSFWDEFQGKQTLERYS